MSDQQDRVTNDLFNKQQQALNQDMTVQKCGFMNRMILQQVREEHKATGKPSPPIAEAPNLVAYHKLNSKLKFHELAPEDIQQAITKQNYQQQLLSPINVRERLEAGALMSSQKMDFIHPIDAPLSDAQHTPAVIKNERSMFLESTIIDSDKKLKNSKQKRKSKVASKVAKTSKKIINQIDESQADLKLNKGSGKRTKAPAKKKLVKNSTRQSADKQMKLAYETEEAQFNTLVQRKARAKLVHETTINKDYPRDYCTKDSKLEDHFEKVPLTELYPEHKIFDEATKVEEKTVKQQTISLKRNEANAVEIKVQAQPADDQEAPMLIDTTVQSRPNKADDHKTQHSIQPKRGDRKVSASKSLKQGKLIFKLNHPGNKCFKDMKQPTPYKNVKGKIYKQMQIQKTFCTICNKALMGASNWHKERHKKTPMHIKNLVIYCQNQDKKQEVSNETLLKQQHEIQKQVRKSEKRTRHDVHTTRKMLSRITEQLQNTRTLSACDMSDVPLKTNVTEAMFSDIDIDEVNSLQNKDSDEDEIFFAKSSEKRWQERISNLKPWQDELKCSYSKVETRKKYIQHIQAWLVEHPLTNRKSYKQEEIFRYLNKQKQTLSSTALSQVKAALSWLFLNHLYLTHLTTKIVKSNRNTDKKKPHTYWEHAEIKEMLQLPKEPQRQDYKMQLAGWLMYEMALRRQDAIKLTFGHFSNFTSKTDSGCTVKFYCEKQYKDREILVSNQVIAMVNAYKDKLTQWQVKVDDSTKLFPYKYADSFALALSAFIQRNVQDKKWVVQTHDFRVSRVCQMHIDGMSMQQIQRFLQHADQRTTEVYIKEIAQKIRQADEDRQRKVPMVLVSSIVHGTEQQKSKDVAKLMQRAPKRKRQPSSKPKHDISSKRARVN